MSILANSSHRHPRFNVLIADTHGIARGLSMPISDKEDFIKGAALSWSSSLFSSRFDGGVVEETGRGIRCGDPDYPCYYVDGTLMPTPWDKGDEQGVFAMFLPDGLPYALDPYHVLNAVVKKFTDMNLNIAMATEFEFYLIDDQHHHFEKSNITDLYSLDEISRNKFFLDLLISSCEQQGLPIGNVISEYGKGQWEVNLNHKPPMQAALEGILLRHAVRSCARSCGKRATFIPKPYANMSGSGMHIHISIWKDGKNIFTHHDKIMNAIAGILNVTCESTLFYAPFDNSYRRFIPDNYAPIELNWGRENRGAMVRIPTFNEEKSTRLEFRLCGADVNPFLVVASLLAGIHWGLEKGLQPPAENVQTDDVLPMTWHAAIQSFKNATVLPHYMNADFLQNYGCIKEDEWKRHRQYISDYDTLYYGRVL